MPSLAWLVLSVHLAIILFNVAGLVLIPLGAWRQWRWVRGFWWRLIHVLVLAIVAAQALAGRACFLTIWQAGLSNTLRPRPLIATWVDHLIYWPLPLWFFTVLYVAVWGYVLYLWWRVPPRVPWGKASREQQ